MDKLNSFLQYLQKFVDLSEDEFNRLIVPDIEIRNFKRKDQILKRGEVEQYQNFVASGLVRKFYIQKSEEVLTQIATEGHVISVQESFYSHTPSEFTLQALEPTTLISMNYNNLQKVYSYNAKMERIGRLVVTAMMMAKDRWLMNMVRCTPRERFIDFVTKNPDLLQRVPQKFLASYLNIQPETFSRFKHLLKDKKITNGILEK